MERPGTTPGRSPRGARVPTWVLSLSFTGPPDEVRVAVAGHRARIDELATSGIVRLSGTLDADDGALVVFEADDLLAAQALARTDPLVESGVASWTLHELHELHER
jgi:uncharacterized protein YciI